MTVKIYARNIKNISAEDFEKEVGKVMFKKSGKLQGARLKRNMVYRFAGGRTPSSVKKQLVREEGLSGTPEKQEKREKLLGLVSGGNRDGKGAVRPGVKVKIKKGLIDKKRRVILPPWERPKAEGTEEIKGIGKYISFAGGNVEARTRLKTRAEREVKGSVERFGLKKEYRVAALADKNSVNPLTSPKFEEAGLVSGKSIGIKGSTGAKTIDIGGNAGAKAIPIGGSNKK